MAVKVNDGNFEKEVLKSDLPVLVDFWAQWCGPCKMMEPALEEIESEYTGKLKVAKVNIDEAADVAANCSVMSIPTFILYKDSQEAGRLVGAMPKEKLIQWLADNI